MIINMIMAAIVMASFKWIADGNTELLMLMIGYFVVSYQLNIMDAIGNINKNDNNTY